MTTRTYFVPPSAAPQFARFVSTNEVEAETDGFEADWARYYVSATIDQHNQILGLGAALKMCEATGWDYLGHKSTCTLIAGHDGEHNPSHVPCEEPVPLP